MDVRGRSRIQAALALVTVALASCAPPDGAEVRFEIPRGGFPEFLDTPYPSDLLVTEDGRLDLGAFPNPGGSDLLESYLGLIAGSGGWSVASTLYFRVDGGVDDATLPADPAASMEPGASVYLRLLGDPGSRIPIEWRSYPEGTSFLPEGTVAVRPVPGATFDGPVALVVTNAVRDRSGGALTPSSDLRALLTCAPLDVDVDCAPYAKLAEETRRPIALAQIVTPRDATTELRRAAVRVRHENVPVVEGLTLERQLRFYNEYRGSLDLAQFLSGRAPFTVFDGETGGVVLSDEGGFEQQGTEVVDFVLTVPKGDPPAGGFPIAIYGHGTGGDLESPLGEDAGDPARRLAVAGWAMISTSEPLHFGRDGFREGQEELLTFNFLNPVAGRDVWRQSVLEKVQLVTAAQGIRIPGGIVLGEERPTITFDADRVGFLGHSQGGIVGSMFVGVDERLHAVFLSGAGASFAISLVEKTEPYVLSEVMGTLLSLEPDDELDRFHPVPNLVQLWIDEADPLAYGALLRAKDAPSPHLVATAGLLDAYTPKGTQIALVGAFRLPLVTPVAERFDVVDLLGVGSSTGPVSLNHTTPGGARVTRGALQYPEDGHFAIFRNPDAQAAVTTFFATAAQGVPFARVR
jgi:hypothetical protein